MINLFMMFEAALGSWGRRFEIYFDRLHRRGLGFYRQFLFIFPRVIGSLQGHERVRINYNSTTANALWNRSRWAEIFNLSGYATQGGAGSSFTIDPPPIERAHSHAPHRHPEAHSKEARWKIVGDCTKALGAVEAWWAYDKHDDPCDHSRRQLSVWFGMFILLIAIPIEERRQQQQQQ